MRAPTMYIPEKPLWPNSAGCAISRGMKLIRQTPDELLLLHRPILLCIALAAGAALALGAAVWNITQGEWLKTGIALLATAGLVAPALWFGAERVQIAFSRTSGTCTIDTHRLSGAQHEVFRLDEIDAAIVETHKGQGDTAGSHRVALTFTAGDAENRRPLTPGYAGGKGAKDIAARINGWLDTARPPAEQDLT
ncbi:hypothetical protein RD1_1316 [Roseobacter denitrificans OCh 114]|uniref:Integral membrane protein n=2 Tax=Roseobacter denitrificans TaxID=2434 RepID=Q16AN3_ROSDO|nr:hypothetical protein RD1_1316 [Roseobacter denitrificans OCh 114]